MKQSHIYIPGLEETHHHLQYYNHVKVAHFVHHINQNKEEKPHPMNDDQN